MGSVLGSAIRNACMAAALGGWQMAAADDEASGQVPAIIIPSWAQAPIAHDHVQAIASYNHATLSGVWSTTRPPVAPEETLALLSMLERTFDGDNTLTAAMYAQAVNAALAAGSKDPMVLYAQARFCEHDALAQMQRLREAAVALDHGPYPAVRPAAAWMRLLGLQLSARGQVDADVCDHAIAGLKAWLVSLPQDDTGAINALVSSSNVLVEDQRFLANGVADKVLAALADPAVPAWWSHVLQGRVHVSLAWMARGSGWADSVSEDGWKGMRDHLTQARRHLVAAWRSHPERSLPCDYMIVAAMGGATENGDCLAWFQRAVAAEMDDMQAYHMLSYAWTPRWGGSYEAMLALGDTAAHTQRFDTAVPYRLINQVEEIWSDAHSLRADRPAILDKDVYARCGKVVDGYLQRMEPAARAKVASYYACERSVLAYMCGMPDECVRELDAAGGSYPQSVFNVLKMTPAQLRAEASSQLGKQTAGDAQATRRPAPANDDGPPPM